MTEGLFLSLSRPWPNYNTDYKPLIDWAKYYQQPVLAANVPRRYASFVSNNLTTNLYTMPAVEQSYMAPAILPLNDSYWTLFETMAGHVPPAVIWLYYESQCLKDNTMAMSIADL